MPRFRTILPAIQTGIAVIFGGWGLWKRSWILSHSVFGWNSTMRYHVWPWQFRLALILNVPAFLSGALFLWPMDKYASNLPEALECGALLPFVFVLWYWIGSRLDRRCHASDWGPWIALLTFTSAGLILSVLPIRWSDFIPFGVAVWLATVIAIIWATRTCAGQVA